MRCDVDSKALSAAEPDLTLAFVSPVLNLRSAISGCSEVKAAAKAVPDEMGPVLARKKVPVREVSPGLDATQVMTGHITFYQLCMKTACCTRCAGTIF